MYPSEKNPGFGTFVKNISKQLSKDGYNVDKIIIDKKTRSIYKLFQYCVFYFKIIKNFKKYDYLYIHFISHTSLPLILLNSLGFKFNLISHIHGGDIKLLNGFSKTQFFLKKIIVQKTLDISKLILIPSQNYKTYLFENYTVSYNKILVYPSGGVDLELFRLKKDIDRNTKLIGYAGRLIKSKNVDLLIKSLIKKPDLILEIIGDGPELTYLIKLTQEYSLTDRVTFISPVSQKELSDWYNKINILIYPSDSESLGLVPLEAISCGARTILSNIPAFKELHDIGIITSFIDLNISNVVDSISNELDNLLNEEPDIEIKNYEINASIINKKYSSNSTSRILKNVFR